MAKKTGMGNELLFYIAKDSGLGMDDVHMKSLYAYVQGLRPTLKTVEDLDLRGYEPFLPCLKKE